MVYRQKPCDYQAEGMHAIEECLRKRTSFRSLEEALVVGLDARAHHRLLICARLSHLS